MARGPGSGRLKGKGPGMMPLAVRVPLAMVPYAPRWPPARLSARLRDAIVAGATARAHSDIMAAMQRATADVEAARLLAHEFFDSDIDSESEPDREEE